MMFLGFLNFMYDFLFSEGINGYVDFNDLFGLDFLN